MTVKIDAARLGRQASPSPPTERVVTVMQLLGADRRRQFTLAEISRTLGISRATAHAILTTLVAHNWATRDPHTAGYAWGPALIGLTKSVDVTMLHGELRKLAAASGTQVLLTQLRANMLVVTDIAGQSLTGRLISRGTCIPLMAPLGRDFVAYSSPAAQDAWLLAIGDPSAALRDRIQAVFGEIRKRRYVVETLSHEGIRVWTALRDLPGDGKIDAVTTRLAQLFAEGTSIDVLDAEMAPGTAHNIATISAPIFDANGAVTMSVAAAPFSGFDGPAVRGLGEQVRAAAVRIQDCIAG